jgi:hypothetical protein
MSAQPIGINSTPAGTSDLPEVFSRLHRAESCAESLCMLISQLNDRLASVSREQAPAGGTGLKEVKCGAPLARQIDSLADLLYSAAETLESVIARLEI